MTTTNFSLRLCCRTALLTVALGLALCLATGMMHNPIMEVPNNGTEANFADSAQGAQDAMDSDRLGHSAQTLVCVRASGYPAGSACVREDGASVRRSENGRHPPLAMQASQPKTRVARMKVTAYCPCKLCCGPRACGITASGKPVSANGGRFCAADRTIPFGTIITIPGYGRVRVLDRGGAIKGNHLDVYFPLHSQARAWGVRYLNVEMER